MFVERGTQGAFSGDTRLEKITPNPVVEVNLPLEQKPYNSISCFKDSLDTLLGFNAARIYPGHGPDFGHGSQCIAAVKEHFTRRRGVVLGRLADGSRQASSKSPLTLYQLTCKLFPGLRGLENFLGVSEGYAYLQTMRESPELEQWTENGLMYFRWNDPRGGVIP
jgi:hypothetical protein